MNYFYDIEVSASFFEIGFLPQDTPQDAIDFYIDCDKKGASLEEKAILRDQLGFIYFVIHEEDSLDTKNFVLDTLKLFIKESVEVLIDYNGNHYDEPLLDFVIHYTDDLKTFTSEEAITIIKQMSDDIIGFKFENPRYGIKLLENIDTLYIPHDVMRMHNLHKTRVSLKHLCIITKHYRIQDLPYDHKEHIPKFKLNEVLDYNFNDILALRKIYYYDFEEVESRYLAASKWKLPLSKTLSASRANLASIYLLNEYSIWSGKSPYAIKKLRTYRRRINYVDIIDPNIKFKHKSFVNFLNQLKLKNINVGEDFAEHVIFNGVRYDIKLGGLHSKDRPDIFKKDDNYYYIDGDVDSFYPFVILNLRICPAHLDPDIFLEIFKTIVYSRIEYKKLKDPEAGILKIVINAIFGKFKDERDFLFDPKATYQTTINGQLYLLKWIEMLYYNKITAISANTDGIVSKIPKDKFDRYYSVSDEWAKMFGFTLSFKEYLLYARLNVNAYMAIDVDNNIKSKGTAFTSKPTLDKGFDTPIIAISLHNYFKDNIPIEHTIKNHTDIFDFTLTQKAGSNFQMIYNEYVSDDIYTTVLQKTNRFYSSDKGYTIFKHDKNTNKLSAYYKNIKLKVLNDLPNYNNISDFNINYSFYISKATHLLEHMYHLNTKEIKGTKRKSGISGKLFDNLEEFEEYEEIDDYEEDSDIF